VKRLGPSWHVKQQRSRWLLQENGVTKIEFPAGEALNEAAAKKIAAEEHGFTYGTFRDAYRDIDLAMRAK
jgi:hypothetical protein